MIKYVIIGVMTVAVAGGSLIFGVRQLYQQQGEQGNGTASLSGTTSNGGGTAGCYIPDNKMRDLSVITSGQQASTILNDSRLKSADQIARLEKIVTEAKKQQVNPALPIAIWGQEQGFGNVTGRTFGVLAAPMGFDNQLPEMIRYLNRDIAAAEGGQRLVTDSKGNYTATSVFDYTMQRYTPTYLPSFGNDPERKTLISFLKKLIPNDLTCTGNVTQTTSGISGITTVEPPNSRCPSAICVQKMLPFDGPNFNPYYGQPKVIILHYLAGSPPLTPQKAWNYFSSGDKHVQFVIGQDGTIYQFEPETKQAAGAKGYNVVPGGITISIENEGHFEDGVSAHNYTQAQLNANIKLVKYLMTKYNIPKTEVISHKDADARQGVTKRRSDPGQKFMQAVLSAL